MVNDRPERLSKQEHRAAAPRPLRGHELWLPLAMLAAPGAWALHFALSYGLVYPAQRWQSKTALHVVSLLSVASCVACIALGWRGLRRVGLGGVPDGKHSERTRFLAVSTCVLGAFFLLASLAQLVPELLLSLEAR